jgi:hypothetical protein
MDLRYKLVITAIISGFTLEYIVFPGLNAADTVVNILSVGIAGLLGALNYWFFTKVENKWDK